MLCVGLAQAERDGACALELLGLIQIELKVVALAFLLQRHKLFMRARNAALQVSTRGDEFLPRGRNRPALGVKLRLEACEANVIGAMVDCGLGMRSGRRLCFHLCGWRGRRGAQRVNLGRTSE